MEIRKAEKTDIDRIQQIYEAIHDAEEQGLAVIGRIRDVYPTRKTAEDALARDCGCTALHMDTNTRNERARRLYQSLGYREAGIVRCVFNGIPGVALVCLEKGLKPVV